MADDYPVRAILPRDMRPRSTPNAEINAQNRDKFLREHRGEPEPPVKDVPLRGYARGGKVAPNNRFGFATPGKYRK